MTDYPSDHWPHNRQDVDGQIAEAVGEVAGELEAMYEVLNERLEALAARVSVDAVAEQKASSARGRGPAAETLALIEEVVRLAREGVEAPGNASRLGELVADRLVASGKFDEFQPAHGNRSDYFKAAYKGFTDP